MIYLILKSLHISVIVIWLSVMLLLPLLVWRLGCVQSEEYAIRLELRRVFHWVSTPSMILSWVLGLSLLSVGGFIQENWMMGKLLLVILLSALHGFFSGQLRYFCNSPTCALARCGQKIALAEAAILVVIVFLVVVKPF